jgi:secreted trypsin-like serine protease
MHVSPRRLSLLVIVLAAVLAAPAAAAASARTPQIVGGTEVAPGTWPAFVNLEIISGPVTYLCGGSVIGRHWVLTAAHCVTTETGALLPGIRVIAAIGITSLASVPLDAVRHVDRIVLGPYEAEALSADWALLRLSDPAPDGQALRLPRAGTAPFPAGTPARVAGFGRTSDEGQISVDLLEVTIPLMDDGLCKSLLAPFFITETMLCAGVPAGGLSPCHGDSGGPLVVDDPAGAPLQIGVVSWGFTCAAPNEPTAFTRLLRYGQEISAALAADPDAPAGAPSILDAGATAVSLRSTRVNAGIDPNGLATQVRVEYGLTDDYGMTGVAYGGAGDPGEIAFELAELQTGKTYHYRVVAENVAGLDENADGTFRAGDDDRPPRVRALPGSGRAGARARIRYEVEDLLGGTVRETVTISTLAGRRIAILRFGPAPAPEGTVRSRSWKIPANVTGNLRFCVEARDQGGDTSRPSCARMRIT